MGLRFMNNDSLGSPFDRQSNYSTTILNCQMLQVISVCFTKFTENIQDEALNA